MKNFLQAILSNFHLGMIPYKFLYFIITSKPDGYKWKPKYFFSCLNYFEGVVPVGTLSKYGTVIDEFASVFTSKLWLFYIIITLIEIYSRL